MLPTREHPPAGLDVASERPPRAASDWAEAPPALDEGDPIAPGYEVVAHLSRSRTLDVYDVWSEDRACRCVAKALRPDRLEDARSRRRLLAEGRLLRRLAHPHIVRAYETIAEPDPVVILEMLGGQTLSYMIAAARRRRIALADVLELGMQLCSAVAYLHRAEVLHLDLKPSNVVIDQGGTTKVIDLSIARRPGRARAGVGTRVYMAPEQVRGGTVGTAADVWGIGTVLFEAAAGRRPFEGREASYPQLGERAPRLRTLRRVPPGFDDLLAACLDPDPVRRPPLEHLWDVLDAVAEEV